MHRDIKPDNVLIDDGVRIRLIDFGVARIENSDLTRDRAVVGPPSYLSPEAAQGERVDWRAVARRPLPDVQFGSSTS